MDNEQAKRNNYRFDNYRFYEKLLHWSIYRFKLSKICSCTGTFKHRYVHVQVCSCTGKFTYRNAHVRVCSCTFVQVRSFTVLFIYRYIHVQVRTCTDTFTYRYVHLRVLSCTACSYAYMFMYRYVHVQVRSCTGLFMSRYVHVCTYAVLKLEILIFFSISIIEPLVFKIIKLSIYRLSNSWLEKNHRFINIDPWN